MKQFCKQFGLNAIYAGKHWSKRREDAEYIHNTVRAALMQQRIPCKVFQTPVKISFCWNDRLDIDNHAYLGKLIVDTLKGWLIQDDNRRFVREVRHEFYDGDCILVEIEQL
jgi:Holliday junction resolvase RusA-like endonuclease